MIKINRRRLETYRDVVNIIRMQFSTELYNFDDEVIEDVLNNIDQYSSMEDMHNTNLLILLKTEDNNLAYISLFTEIWGTFIKLDRVSYEKQDGKWVQKLNNLYGTTGKTT